MSTISINGVDNITSMENVPQGASFMDLMAFILKDLKKSGFVDVELQGKTFIYKGLPKGMTEPPYGYFVKADDGESTVYVRLTHRDKYLEHYLKNQHLL